MFSTTLSIGALLLSSFASPPSDDQKNPYLQLMIEAAARARSSVEKGESCLKEGDRAEALKHFRTAYMAEKQGGIVGTYSVAYAKLLTQMGRQEEGLTIFGEILTWDPKSGDFGTKGVRLTPFLIDYLNALSSAGQLQRGKEVYYWGVRQLHNSRFSKEPVPFLVTFDAERGLDSWDPSAANFDLACKAIAVIRLEDKGNVWLKEIMGAKPNWYWPWVMLAHRGGDKEACLAKARELASPKEKAWIDAIPHDRQGLSQKNEIAHAHRAKSFFINRRRPPSQIETPKEPDPVPPV